MVIFRVEVGAQVSYFEADSFEAAVRAAIAAGVPAHLVKVGQFFEGVKLSKTDSKAEALRSSL